MSEFVFLFRSTHADADAALGTPERAEKSLKAWLAWIRELESAGQLKDPGQPLARTGMVVRGDVVTDGPYVETKDLVLGFIVIRARDASEAAQIAQRCPIAIGGGSVEVRPVQALAM